MMLGKQKSSKISNKNGVQNQQQKWCPKSTTKMVSKINNKNGVQNQQQKQCPNISCVHSQYYWLLWNWVTANSLSVKHGLKEEVLRRKELSVCLSLTVRHGDAALDQLYTPGSSDKVLELERDLGREIAELTSELERMRCYVGLHLRLLGILKMFYF